MSIGKFEYLIVALALCAGALALAFEPRVGFRRYWRFALPAVGAQLLLMMALNAVAVGNLWRFNENVTTGWRLWGAPVEEWLYFVGFPALCLYAREALRLRFKNSIAQELEWARAALFALIPIGVILARAEKQYAGLVFVALGAIAFADRQLKTDLLLQTRTYLYCAVAVALALLADVYRAGRPIALYDPSQLAPFRLWMIPIENIGYALCHILATAFFYDYFKLRAGALRESMT